MKRGDKILAYVLSGIALSSCARAFVNEDSGSPANPYQGIVERNVFNLKPAAPVVPPEPPPPPLPKLTLTGISTILGKKMVGLKAAIPPKAPDPAREDLYMLAEGQMKGDIEIVQIDVAGGRVQVKNHGFPQSLNFTNDGAKLVSVPLAPAAAAPAVNFQPGAANPANPAVPAPGRTIPRAMRLPQTPNSAGAQPAMMPAQGGTPAAGQMSFGTASSQQNSTASFYENSPASRMTPEQQMIMIEVERERTKQAVASGQMPALPQTPVTPKQEAPQ